ncbi:MAG: MFS transporter [Oscillatoriales cyanobacterium RM2_1_1]|nr:MFS transporter [Oscillatoriales cyanobacterium RM2_1_1]
MATAPPNSNDAPAAEKLNLSTKVAFGAGDLGTAITANLLSFVLLVFLTNVAGMPAGLAGSVYLVGKISDAINDPIIGVMSDRTVHPWGRRYPWMIFGAIPFGVFFALQWIVPSTNLWVLFWYYSIIAVIFNLTYTIVNLPYTALTPELTQDYNERTSLNSFRFAFSIGGSILSLILALVISLLIPGDLKRQYLVLGLICAVISVLPIFWCVLGTRQRIFRNRPTPNTPNPEASMPLKAQIRVAFQNRPFLYVVGVYLFSWLAVQLTAAILPYFVQNWMKLSNTEFYFVAIAVQGTAIVMLFVWTHLSQRYGKRVVYFMGITLWLIAQIGLLFLQPGQVALMYILAMIAGCGVSTAYLIPWSMIPDVVDLDELNTGQRREGVFYAFMVFLQKIGLALGLFLVGQALQLAGFQETTPGQPLPIQPDSALFAIRMAIAPIPALTLVAGMVLTYFYPITREVHTEILLKLSQRQENL